MWYELEVRKNEALVMKCCQWVCFMMLLCFSSCEKSKNSIEIIVTNNGEVSLEGEIMPKKGFASSVENLWGACPVKFHRSGVELIYMDKGISISEAGYGSNSINIFLTQTKDSGGLIPENLNVMFPFQGNLTIANKVLKLKGEPLSAEAIKKTFSALNVDVDLTSKEKIAFEINRSYVVFRIEKNSSIKIITIYFAPEEK